MAMDAPLLIADVPWLLYRAFFALPKSIKGADGRAGERAAGHRERAAGGDRSAIRRGRWWPASGQSRRATAWSRIPPTTPTATRCPTELAEQWRARPGAARELRLDYRRRRGVGGRRRDGLLRAGGGAGGWACVAADRRSRPLPGRGRASRGIGFGEGRGVRRRWDRDAGAGALRRAPDRCPTSSPCGETPPTAFPGRRESARRQRRRCCRATARSRPCWKRRSDSTRTRASASCAREWQARCTRTRSCCARSSGSRRSWRWRWSAQPDTPTDFAGGAAKAREMGMKRLAERLATSAYVDAKPGRD